MKFLLSGHISKMYQEWRPVLFENAVPNATSLKPDAKPDTKWTVRSKAASYSLLERPYSPLEVSQAYYHTPNQCHSCSREPIVLLIQ